MIDKAIRSRASRRADKPRGAGQDSPVVSRAMGSPLGTLLVSASARGVCAIEFARRDRFTLKLPNEASGLKDSKRTVAAAIAQLREYFAGRRFRFDVPVDRSALTGFQRQVLAVIQKIPAGETWTYGQVAEKLGRPKSARPVGQALARNPVPIIIPCHRVVAGDGALRGYSGGSGITTKRWLLQHEGARW